MVKLPRGHENPIERDPYTFSLSEWQQAKRAKKDPRALKALFQECWAQSDSRASFTQAIKERGYMLAKGDRRGFVPLTTKARSIRLSLGRDQGQRCFCALRGFIITPRCCSRPR